MEPLRTYDVDCGSCKKNIGVAMSNMPGADHDASQVSALRRRALRGDTQGAQQVSDEAVKLARETIYDQEQVDNGVSDRGPPDMAVTLATAVLSLHEENERLKADREACYVAAEQPAWGGPLDEKARAALRKVFPDAASIVRKAMTELRVSHDENTRLRAALAEALEMAAHVDKEWHGPEIERIAEMRREWKIG